MIVEHKNYSPSWQGWRARRAWCLYPTPSRSGSSGACPPRRAVCHLRKTPARIRNAQQQSRIDAHMLRCCRLLFCRYTGKGVVGISPPRLTQCRPQKRQQVSSYLHTHGGTRRATLQKTGGGGGDVKNSKTHTRYVFFFLSFLLLSVRFQQAGQVADYSSYSSSQPGSCLAVLSRVWVQLSLRYSILIEFCLPTHNDSRNIG